MWTDLKIQVNRLEGETQKVELLSHTESPSKLKSSESKKNVKWNGNGIETRTISANQRKTRKQNRKDLEELNISSHPTLETLIELLHEIEHVEQIQRWRIKEIPRTAN
jgi:hypothetical protein